MKLKQGLAECHGIAPGFHLIRHALAGSILLFHCYLAVIGTSPAAAAAAATNAPTLAHSSSAVELVRPFLFSLVGAFFALSGFLVTGSAVRSSTATFFANRVLRIVPALAAEVLLSALLLGPLITSETLQNYFLAVEFRDYMWNLLGHIHFILPGVFETNPWPFTVNLSLWTLPYELWCYAIMLVLLALGIVSHDRWLTILVLAGLLIACLMPAYDPVGFAVKSNTTHFAGWYIVFLFFVGMLAFLRADVIPLSWPLFFASLAAYYLSIRFDILTALSGFPLVYCVVFVGMRRFAWFDRLMKMDLSYGIYLYGFPITQALVWALRPTIGTWSTKLQILLIAPLLIALTALFAVASWKLIEKPALSLRKYVIRRMPPAAGSDAIAA